MSHKDYNLFMSTGRIEALVDGIFAIAMTILVLTLAVPDVTGPLSNYAVQNALYGIFPSFYTLVMSFLLLALFWTLQHRIFHRIKQVDTVMLWINLIWLLFIVLVPFFASLTGKYPQFAISHVLSNLNMFGIALFLYLCWHYASKRDFIHEKVDDNEVTSIRVDIIIFLIITLSALVLSFIIPDWSSLVYVLIFPLEFISHRLWFSGK
ncbi:TMEM175 family protein [Methanobacterium sp.]|uniref:TMEM175 family protein n=1 Tax=Methanobacterium sp. TaxID=2164 RepID=UPI003C7504DF